LDTSLIICQPTDLVQLDYDLVDYVSQLREGILEAYTGIVTGLKKTPKGKGSSNCRLVFLLTNPSLVSLLLPYVQSILELVNRCIMDEERTDALMRLSYGLIGDLADCFPDGQIKPLLLSHWIAAEFRTRHRMPDETKKTLRWAREVCVRLS
jgi:importin subunit beta-1